MGFPILSRRGEGGGSILQVEGGGLAMMLKSLLLLIMIMSSCMQSNVVHNLHAVFYSCVAIANCSWVHDTQLFLDVFCAFLSVMHACA